MPLTYDEYGCLRDFSVLYSGGLDSAAVAIYLGQQCQGKAHLLTYKHSYGALFNEWSRRHNPDMARVLGPDRFEHHLIDLTEVWNEVGFKKVLQDGLRFGGHWVLCLGCQQSMAAHTIAYDLEHNVTNAFICSSVGGEYAVMSMGVTRQKNIENYARYGVRYNAPLLDLGINKEEERRLLRSYGVEPGWGRRRSHQGFQPICLLGFQHALDIVVDFHTTYPPDRVGQFLDEKFEIMDRVIRAMLTARGLDPDALIAANLAKYQEEERALAELRTRKATQAG